MTRKVASAPLPPSMHGGAPVMAEAFAKAVRLKVVLDHTTVKSAKDSSAGS